MSIFFIACDHGGINLKERIVGFFNDNGISFKDLGTNSKSSVDYPDFAHLMASKIGPDDLGILICKTGIGMSIVANRHHNIRAALCRDSEDAALAKQHNNANVLVLGANKITDNNLIKILSSFIKSKFEGGRHLNRVKKFNIKVSI